ncbi:MAG: hypothetical protein C5B53_04385 [Candidatus Melainabacteria bacterium]|nr:MAG: hypothetical protein C5B53_04385 [Candidatus Melainabacteria bacterium]
MKDWRNLLFASFGALVLNISGAVAQDSGKEELINKVHEYTHSWWQPLIVKSQMDFDMSSDWWSKMLEQDGWGIKTVSNFAYDLNDFYKRQGLGDLEDIESANNNDRDANRARVESAIENLRNKASFKLATSGVKCDATSFDLCHRYMISIAEFLAKDNWLPKGGEAHITLVLSPTAKSVGVAVNPDGKHFTIDAPANVEVDEWDTKISNGLKRGGQNAL